MKNAVTLVCWLMCLVLTNFPVALWGQVPEEKDLVAAELRRDSLKAVLATTPDSLRPGVVLDLAETFSMEKETDSVWAYAQLARQLAMTYGDTVSWRSTINDLYTAGERLGRDSTELASLLQQARELQARYGYQTKHEFTNFSNSYRYVRIRYSLMLLADSSQELSWQEVKQAPDSLPILPGYRFIDHVPTPEVDYWAKLRLHNPYDRASRELFMVGMEGQTWDTVDLYFSTPDGNWTHERTGRLIPIEEKTAIKDYRSLFYIDLPPQGERTVYLHLRGLTGTRRPFAVQLNHLPPDFLTDTEAKAVRNMAVFLGILSAMGFYFFLLFLAIRERTYLPYLVYLIGNILFALTAYKYHDWFPTSASYEWFLYAAFSCIAGLGLLEFALSYLNIRRFSPLWVKISRMFMICFSIPPVLLNLVTLLAIVAPKGMQNDYDLSWIDPAVNFLINAYFLLITLGLMLIVLLGILAWRKGFKPAREFLVGIFFLIVLVGITPAMAALEAEILIGWFSFAWAVLAAQVGIVLQLCFFALGVGKKIQLLEEENARALAARLQAEEEANAKLRQADKMKDEFLANTSHELRTPLNGIIGITEAVHEGVTGPTTPEMRDNLAMVIHAAKRLSGLVNDILDFSKLKNFELELQQRPIDLRPLTEVVLKVSESMLGGKSLTLTTHIPADLPPAFADENRLQQILYNLIGNAIKFTQEGEVKVQATVTGEFIAVSVSDTGIGIPADKQQAIFRSFEQGDGSTARQFGGTGLGLSITKQLVELHGGQITVESTPGQGSTFTFTLPVSKELPSVAPQDAAPGGQLQTLEPLRGAPSLLLGSQAGEAPKMVTDAPLLPIPAKGSYHILVVDDEPVNRQVLKNHLSTEKYFVTSVMNGIEALEAIDSDKAFDLVLLDVMMPKMSGFEVCRKIREKHIPSELPVIMITAKNQVSDLVTGLAQGANDYVVKPFSKPELLARIKTHLNLLRISTATSRFVPYEFLRSLGRENITEVNLGDQVEKTGTVLFADIRGYTTLAEAMRPEEAFAFLNGYLGRMGPIIGKHKGFVNQFFGDGIMALFLDEPGNALQAAIEMQRVLLTYNEQRTSTGRKLISMGCGLHSGSLMMGMIGDERRLDTGLVSDTVNTTSRLEGLTKYYGASVLLSEGLRRQLPAPESYSLRYLGQVQVKGKKAPLAIYDCFDGDPEPLKTHKRQTLDSFTAGLEAYYDRKFELAMAAFEAVLAVFPDPAARHYHQLAQEYLTQGVPANWTGSTVLEK